MSQERNIDKEFADSIVVYRAKHRLTQKEMAALCGISISTLCSVETYQQEASLKTRSKIQLILDADKEGKDAEFKREQD